MPNQRRLYSSLREEKNEYGSVPTSRTQLKETSKENKNDDGRRLVARERKVPDGGWGWCIVVVAFYMNLMVIGFSFSSGVYFPIFLDEFGQSSFKTTFIGSLCSGSAMIVSPLAGALTEKFGYRIVSVVSSAWAGLSILAAAFANSVEFLIITIGVSTGSAMGMLYSPSLVSVGRWFEEKRGTATGITVAGSGLGMIVIPALCSAIIDNFGWKPSLYVISGLFFLGIPLSFLYREVPVETYVGYQDSKLDHSSRNSMTSDPQISKHIANDFDQIEKRYNEQSDTEQPLIARTAPNEENSEGRLDDSVSQRFSFEKTFSQAMDLLGMHMFTDVCFLTHVTAQTILYLGFMIPFIYIADYAMQRGINYRKSSFLISTIGITNLIAKPLVGLSVSMNWLDCVVICNYSKLFGGSVTILLSFMKEYWMMVVYSSLYGICVASHFCTRPLVAVQLLGLENFSYGVSYGLLGNGLGAAIGGPLLGLLHDDSVRSYKLVFILTGAAITLSGIVGLPMQKLSDRQKSVKT